MFLKEWCANSVSTFLSWDTKKENKHTTWIRKNIDKNTIQPKTFVKRP